MDLAVRTCMQQLFSAFFYFHGETWSSGGVGSLEKDTVKKDILELERKFLTQKKYDF